MLRYLAATILLLGLAVSPARAQPLTTQPGARGSLASPSTGNASDSTAAARVLTHVWELLAPRLLAASLDSAAMPWTIIVSDSLLPRERLVAHLRTALRARVPLPGDTLVWWLRVGAVEVRGDTAWARVSEGATRRCTPGTAAATGGWTNDHHVYVPRVRPGGPWGAARTRHMRHGDFAGCRIAKP